MATNVSMRRRNSIPSPWLRENKNSTRKRRCCDGLDNAADPLRSDPRFEKLVERVFPGKAE